MMLSNEVLEVAAIGMQTCLNATLHVERYSVREQATDSRGECCLPVPRESVACSRTLYLSTCPTERNQGVKGQATLVATVPSRRHDQGKKARLEPCLFWRCEFFCINATGGAAERQVRHSPADAV